MKSLTQVQEAVVVVVGPVVAIGIGLFGVAASFSAQVLARRREFGLLAHLGLTRQQILGVVALEGLAWTVLGALAGLALGLGVSLVLVHVVNPQSFHWTMDLAVPGWRLLGLCAAVVVSGTVTAWLAGRAARRILVLLLAILAGQFAFAGYDHFILGLPLVREEPAGFAMQARGAVDEEHGGAHRPAGGFEQAQDRAGRHGRAQAGRSSAAGASAGSSMWRSASSSSFSPAFWVSLPRPLMVLQAPREKAMATANSGGISKRRERSMANSGGSAGAASGPGMGGEGDRAWCIAKDASAPARRLFAAARRPPVCRGEQTRRPRGRKVHAGPGPGRSHHRGRPAAAQPGQDPYPGWQQ